ncbi:hypothetical protein ACSQ67_005164 [Phaseolus vulgaris]
MFRETSLWNYHQRTRTSSPQALGRRKLSSLAKEKTLKSGEGENPQARRRRKPSSPSSSAKEKSLKPGEGESPQARRRRKEKALAKAKALMRSPANV